MRSKPATSAQILGKLAAYIISLSLIPALWHWTWPDAVGWIWLLLTGLLGTAGQVCMTRAYQAGEVSALVPLNFIQLPVVVTCAYFLFDQKFDDATALGAAIIIGANIYIARREAVLAARTRTALASSGPAE